ACAALWSSWFVSGESLPFAFIGPGLFEDFVCGLGEFVTVWGGEVELVFGPRVGVLHFPDECAFRGFGGCLGGWLGLFRRGLGGLCVRCVLSAACEDQECGDAGECDKLFHGETP